MVGGYTAHRSGQVPRGAGVASESQGSRAAAVAEGSVWSLVSEATEPFRPFAPLRLASAAEQIADRLVTAIALGQFSPGERLPSERALAELLGTSRTSVREALGRLAAAGYVEIRRGRAGGAYVRGDWTASPQSAVRRTLAPRWRAMEELFDFRSLAEGLIARTAAARRGAADIAALQEALRGYEQAPSLTAAREADAQLHRAVGLACRNSHLVALSRDLLTQVGLGFPAEPFTQAVYDRALPEHRELVAAVVAGDEEAAWHLGATHFAITADALRDLLAQHGGG